MDINAKSLLENGTVDASVVRKTNVIIIDEFSMIDCTIFITIEQLCRTFSSKDGLTYPMGWSPCFTLWRSSSATTCV